MNWFELTSLLTRPIAFHRIFATIGGGACCGLFLSQAFYWTQRTKDPDGWFYKSQVEWEEETALTRYEQENVRRELKSRGLIEEKKEGIPCRLFYRINKDSLLQALGGYFKPLSVEEILSSCKSTLNQLSQMGVMRAKKLGIEHEYVDYALILKIHGNTCHICNKPITQGVGQSGGALAFDHVIPVSKRGSHTSSNIKPSHASCNISKFNNLSDPCCEQFVVPQQTSLLSGNEQASCATTSQAVVAQQTYLYTETTPETTHTRGTCEKKFGFKIGGSSESLVETPRTEIVSKEAQIIDLDQSFAAKSATTQIYKPTAEEESFYFNRLFIVDKGTYASRSSDPWMNGINPKRCLQQWLLNKRQNQQRNGDERYRSYTPTPENIRKEIRNDAVAAAGLWEDFTGEMHHRIEVYNHRVKSGASIKEEEAAAIVEIAPYADLAPLPLPNPQTTLPPSPQPARPIAALPEEASSVQAYTEYKADLPLTDEEIAERSRRLALMARSIGRPISRSRFNEPAPMTKLEEMRSWLKGNEHALKAEAIAWAKRKSDELDITCDEYGNIIDFEELEF